MSFPDLDQVYVSREPFPLFANRLPPTSRPDYDEFLEWLDLSGGGGDPMVLLARSGGQRETDTFEVFPRPEPSSEGRYNSIFFAHGLRYLARAEEAARALQPGEPLVLRADPENPHDSDALRILTTLGGVHLGFVPRYLCDDVHRLQEAAGEDSVTVKVHRVNAPPTPVQFRLLCALDSPWPAGFRPMSSSDFEPLHSLAPAVRH
jgi:HIRAN domain